MSRSHAVSELADHELIALSKEGDRDAFGELWRRHSDAARRVAAIYAPHVADDITVDAFAAIFQQFQKQGGPDHSFRAYLYTVVRNLAAKEHRGAVHLSDQPLDEQMAAPMTVEDETIAQLESGATATAFRALPERWQTVLWYLDVEGLKPAQVAPLLGIEPNAVSALAVRAREALKQNWIQAQLASSGGTLECAIVDENIGGVVRRKVSKRTQTKIDAHVAGCARCTALIDEGRDLGNRLAAVLFPIATGVSAAALIGGELDGGAAVAAAGPVPPEIFEAPTRVVDAVVLSGTGTPAVPEPSGSLAASASPAPQSGSATGSSSSSAGGIGTTVLVGIAAAALVAGGVAAVTIVDGLQSSGSSETADPVAGGEEPGEKPEPVVPDPEPTDEPEDDPLEPGPVPVVRDADARPTPSTGSASRPEPKPTPSPSPQPEPEPEPGHVAPDAPVLGNIDTAAGGMLPTGLSGTGEPGAAVQVLFDGAVIAGSTVDEDGAWSAAFAYLEFEAGQTALQVRQVVVTDEGEELASAPLEVVVEAAAPSIGLSGWELHDDGLISWFLLDLPAGSSVEVFYIIGDEPVSHAGVWAADVIDGYGLSVTSGTVGTTVQLGMRFIDPETGVRGPLQWVSSVVTAPVGL